MQLTTSRGSPRRRAGGQYTGRGWKPTPRAGPGRGTRVHRGRGAMAGESSRSNFNEDAIPEVFRFRFALPLRCARAVQSTRFTAERWV